MEIENIIVKFLNKEANIVELEKLEEWLKNDENESLFNRFVKIELLTTLSMGSYDVNKAKKQIHNRIKKENRRKRSVLFQRMTVAASILLLIGISVFQFANLFESSLEIEEMTAKPTIGVSKAILTLENGNEVKLEKGKKYQSELVNSNGENLLYAQNKTKDKKVEYNYLTIPRGGEFSVVLADGTKVVLNSDSKLKYPINFIEGETRTIELLYGEAYLEVSPSTKHKGASFNVLSRGQKIDVLGTVFNVKAYSEDLEIKTTLVEGKISIAKGKEKKILYPNEQSVISRDSDIITISEVDVSNEISWVKGLFTFEEARLEEMMKVLARWYDVAIVFDVVEHKHFVFTGKLEKTKSVEDILNTIKETSEGEISFQLSNKAIHIK